MKANKIDKLTPFHNGSGQIIFSYRPLRDICFICPSKPPERFIKKGLIIVPQRGPYRGGIGILLAIGPGYTDDKGGWHPTSDQLKPGVKIAYDRNVPWRVNIEGTDGKKHKVIMCNTQDAYLILEQ